MKLMGRNAHAKRSADGLERAREDPIVRRGQEENFGSEDSDSWNNASTSNESGVDTSTRTGTAAEDDMKEIKEELARHETKQVFRLRVIVMLILLTAAAAVSLTVYHITRKAEIQEFESEFEAVSEKIISALNDVVVQMGAIGGLSAMASTDADDGSAGVWPFITLDGFQERGNNARFLSGAVYVSVNPVVDVENLLLWEKYAQSDVNVWIAQGLELQAQSGLNDFDDSELTDMSWLTSSVVDPLHTYDEAGNPLLSQASSDPVFLPRWQTSPVLETSQVNENLFEAKEFGSISRDCIASKAAVLGGFHIAPPGDTSSPNPTTAFFATLQSMWEGKQTPYLGDPMSHMAVPVFDSLYADDREVVAVLISTFHWSTFLRDILTVKDSGYSVVLENACDEIGNFTYRLDGPDVGIVGVGDLHERKYSSYRVDGVFYNIKVEDGTPDGIPFNQNSCPYSFHIYPTQEEYDGHVTFQPVIISLSIAAVFAFTISMFLLYDRLVERRQKVVLARATHSTAIVSSLFPKQVRDRLLAIEREKDEMRKSNAMTTNNQKLRFFLNGSTEFHTHTDQPIADLFPHCTVMFSDIAGFTAWSSTREPAQVFILLQTVYQNFDLIAKRRRVFKVETIGDSYVAVTGLPEPQPTHATIMARFAWDCVIRIAEIAKELESSLGPDTGDLNMRFGLHSGPVTAGVLKGDRARFQLFGDTVNTAARMESTGEKGRIQISSVTAELLKAAGHDAWLTPRTDAVAAKGKGVLSTHWLVLKDANRSTASSSGEPERRTNKNNASHEADFDRAVLGTKEARLVDWVAEMLLQQIKKVVVVHQRSSLNRNANQNVTFQAEEGKICLDEVQEAICTPEFNADVAEATLDSQLVQTPLEIVHLLRDYVAMIAASYRNNKFHNFEHACHVTMSVAKLLGRVVTPDLSSKRGESASDRKVRNLAAQIHNFTHGLTSDPLATLALVFTGLIHDVDHQGVSNAQLAKEQPELSLHYRNKSVAEQNSLDIAWDLLMADRFLKLREYIFGTQEELRRFRQLIVNMVLATDIFDKELNQLRRDRWERAFHANLPDSVTKDLRATIVMEHIIQASDVSHTMQHWHIYQKFNRRLFQEMHAAYKEGRMGADPRTFWYQGELGFFDNYIIPLAKKLKECNVFGVSSDEYLAYAMKNRAEWEERGQEMIEAMLLEMDSTVSDEKNASCATSGTEATESSLSSTSSRL